MQEIILKLDINTFNILNAMAFKKNIDLSDYAFLPKEKIKKINGFKVKGKYYTDETEYLLSNPKNRKELLQAVKDYSDPSKRVKINIEDL